MGRQSGGIRALQHGGRAYTNRQSEYSNLMMSGKYSDGYFSEKGGGYYVVEQSKYKHKPEEIEAAKHLADAGYKVTLMNEQGTVKTPDGKVFTATYEQRTPTGSIKYALDHAKEKNADVAVIYDKYNSYHRQDIYDGINKFEQHSSYRFDRILVIESKGNVHIHKHGEK